MAIEQEFVETIQTDLRNEALWNPQLFLDNDWEFRIPIEQGVSIRLKSQQSNNLYSISSYLETRGTEPDYDEIKSFLEETIGEVFPIMESSEMTGIDGLSTSFTILYEDLPSNTEQVPVDLTWGEKSIVINVPTEIEDKKTYATDAVNTLLQTDMSTALSAVGLNHREITPSVKEY